jgi:hypothetical protein
MYSVQVTQGTTGRGLDRQVRLAFPICRTTFDTSLESEEAMASESPFDFEVSVGERWGEVL